MLPTNLAALPTIAIVIPNMCDDMHDCPVAAGNAWAQQHLPPCLPRLARTRNSLLIVTSDHLSHYAILRTIEDMHQLAPLGVAAATPPVTGIWAP